MDTELWLLLIRSRLQTSAYFHICFLHRSVRMRLTRLSMLCFVSTVVFVLGLRNSEVLGGNTSYKSALRGKKDLILHYSPLFIECYFVGDV